MKNRINYLLNQYKNDSISESELQELSSLLQKETMTPEFKQVMLTDLLLTQNIHSSGKQDLDKSYQAIHKKLKLNEGAKKGKGYILRPSMLIAAGILGFIMLASTFYVLIGERFRIVEFYSHDSLEEVVLPDGSRVTLNKNSNLAYHINWFNQSRNVVLKGEALFDVEKTGQPFIVQANAAKIKVTGTVFNVYAPKDQNICETTLIEGEVSVFDGNDKNEEVTLKPGQQFVLDDKAGRRMLNEVNVDLYAKWKEDEIRFSNQQFGDLLLVLERRYQVSFKVMNNSLYNYHFDGLIRDESLTEVLDIISMLLPIKYTEDGEKIIITEN